MLRIYHCCVIQTSFGNAVDSVSCCFSKHVRHCCNARKGLAAGSDRCLRPSASLFRPFQSVTTIRVLPKP
ncbi:hypothetical protein RFM67_34075, partial [Mesorhizobium sp. VK2D]|nr:hypothetical protein [Mesorhizobium sp. VK2D]